MSGMKPLRQATAGQSRALGPFVDDTDFKSPEDALVLVNTDIKIISNGGVAGSKNNGGGTFRVHGAYGVTYNEIDTADVGELKVLVKVGGVLIGWEDYWVYTADVFDKLYAATAKGFGNSIKRNQALPNFQIMMTLLGTDAPATGKVVTVTRRIDGGDFVAGTLSAPVENATPNGFYGFNWLAADLNGVVISLLARADGCNDLGITFVTDP